MKIKTQHRCTACGYVSPVWAGKCPQCNEWNTFEEFVVQASRNAKAPLLKEVEAERLIDVREDSSTRIITSMEEFNRCLGGGLVRDSVTILTARPGAGKSTLLLELVKDLADKGVDCVYISGEESKSQIKARARRIMDEIPKNIWILSTNSMDQALTSIRKIKPAVVILDSIQTFQLSQYEQRPGSPTQTIECANAIVEVAKDKEHPTAVLMVGHVTKSDEMAGLRTLEHLVDTVLYLEGESDEELRVLVATKNRFGRTGEIGLFRMGEEGMKEVVNPYEYFITQRGEPVAGSAISMIKEGSRLIAIEVEALVASSYTPYPIRIGDSLRKDQLNTLISILEQRGGLKLYDKNVVLKTTGGLRLTEQAVNLTIMMAIVSSFLNKPVGANTAFIAEVGLTGELKRVAQLDSRIRELDRLGYQKVYVAAGSKRESLKTENIEILERQTVNEVIKEVF